MRCSVSSPDETPRRELKIRRAVEWVYGIGLFLMWYFGNFNFNIPHAQVVRFLIFAKQSPDDFLGPKSAFMFTVFALKIKSFNNFENDTMKESVKKQNKIDRFVI